MNAPTIPQTPEARAARDESYRRAYFARAAAREARQAARDQAKATAAATGKAAGGAPTKLGDAVDQSLTIPLPKSLGMLLGGALVLFRMFDWLFWMGWNACALLAFCTLLGILIGLMTL